MEVDQDSFFQGQLELYPPLSGALPVNQSTFTSHHAHVPGGHYSQFDQPVCRSHSSYNPHLYLATTPYPPPGSSAGDSSASATTGQMADLFKSLPAPGFYDPGEGSHDVPSSDWEVHTKLRTWDFSLSPVHFSTTHQEATLGDETGNTTDSQAIFADQGLEEQDQNEISDVAGAFKCDNPACTLRKPFKRKEHLTRHKKTYAPRHKADNSRLTSIVAATY